MFDGPDSSTSRSEESKVPPITWMFWAIKIAATTLGETGGDAVSMSLRVGYLSSTLIFAAIFAVAVIAQCAARRFHPALYWIVIVATTTTGTTMADFADRSLGLGYVGGTLILAGLLAVTLATWWAVTGSISVTNITSTLNQAFYWAVILFSNTLGTALGDYMADSQGGGAGLGYERGALVFTAALAALGGIYFLTRPSLGERRASRQGALLFWSAFILTRPLGATLGDMLTKPVDHGGLALGRLASSGVIALGMALAIFMLPRNNLRESRGAGHA